MKDKKYYDLYEFRELTESIYCIREIMELVKNDSYQYSRISEIYNNLWNRRNELESKIIGKDDDINNY